MTGDPFLAISRGGLPMEILTSLSARKKKGHTEYVMMDADGPGAVTWFWLTTVVKPGRLRFYFDNEEKASVEIPGFDLLEGFKGAGFIKSSQQLRT